MQNTSRFLSILFFIALMISCANRGSGPQGGAKDITAPVPQKSIPENKQLNYKKSRLEVEFDELIALEKPAEKIIISPPQVTPPVIKASGKKVIVTLIDSLQENTTYSIDFTNSIVDLNERNPLPSYDLSFSTGNQIDSLQVSGIVIDASNLNPLSNYIVGIYANLNDTAFTKTIPLRIGRTNEQGFFSIKSIKADSYHIFALNDLSRDFIYNDPNEQLAFLDSIIVPTSEIKIVSDTIRKVLSKKEKAELPTDSLPPIDSIRQIKKTKFLPDSLILKAFKKNVYKQKLVKTERKEAYKIDFFFASENKKAPTIEPLNLPSLKENIIQFSSKKDSVTYWILDSLAWAVDSIKFKVEYMNTDSTENLIVETDTITSVFKAKPKPKRKNDSPLPTRFMSIKHNIQSSFDVYNPIRLTFNAPVNKLDTSKIHLSWKIPEDSIWTEISTIQLNKADSIGLAFEIPYEWNHELDYRLDIDSLFAENIFGLHNNKLSSTFKIKGPELYSTLIVTLINFNKNAVIQLLNGKDEVRKELPADEEGTIFEFLTPGDYYLRLFIDENLNGQWDTGDYEKKQQPEEVFYFDQAIHLRANWDVDQEWDYSLTPLLKQKPANLIKTGSKETNNRNR